MHVARWMGLNRESTAELPVITLRFSKQKGRDANRMALKLSSSSSSTSAQQPLVVSRAKGISAKSLKFVAVSQQWVSLGKSSVKNK